MGEIVHTGRITIEMEPDRIRRAYFEGFEEPVVYGLHGGVKDFYKADIKEERPTTIEHVAAALAGWMAGTLGGALAARGIESIPGKLKTKVEADIERVDRMIVLSRVRLAYDLTVPRGKRADAERAVEVHHHGCPIYQSFQRGIEVEWTANITEE